MRHAFKICQHLPNIRNQANVCLDSRDGGFCKEKLQNMTEEMLCSDCYMKKIQLEIDEPLDIIHDYTPADFNSLKQSCGIPTASYPIKPTTTTTPTTTPTPA